MIPLLISEISNIETVFKVSIKASALNPVGGILHANLHACKEILGTCTPLIGEIPGLIIQSSVQMAPLTPENGSHYTATFRDSLRLGSGDWVMVAHVNFNATRTVNSTSRCSSSSSSGGGNSTVQRLFIEAATGREVTSQNQLGYLQTTAEVFVVVVACVAFCFYAYVLFLVLNVENPQLWRHNFFSLALMNVVGAVIFTATVFLRTLYMTDATCIAWLWTAVVGFSLMFTPVYEQAVFFFFFPPQRLNNIQHRRQSKTNDDGDGAAVVANRREGMPKIREQLAAVFTTLILGVNVILLAGWMAAETPRARDRPDPDEDFEEFRDRCEDTSLSLAFTGALVTICGILVISALVFLWMAKRHSFQMYALMRMRRGVTIIASVAITTVVIDAAFTEDPELNFLVRSLAIISASGSSSQREGKEEEEEEESEYLNMKKLMDKRISNTDDRLLTLIDMEDDDDDDDNDDNEGW